MSPRFQLAILISCCQKLNAKKAGIPIFSTIVEAMLTVLGYELVFITLYLLFGQFVYSVYWTSCDAFLGLIVK